jgi:hypothetical protein
VPDTFSALNPEPDEDFHLADSIRLQAHLTPLSRLKTLRPEAVTTSNFAMTSILSTFRSFHQTRRVARGKPIGVTFFHKNIQNTYCVY